MFRFPPLSERKLEQMVAELRRANFTYEEVGATRDKEFPEGYRHDRHHRRLGGPELFEPARQGLKLWRAHVGSGASVVPPEANQAGETLLVSIRMLGVQIIAPCRIVYVIDEPDRFGIAYGTLPGHPERGEESFVVQREPAGTFFHVTAFSKPANFVLRLGYPVSRAIQSHFTQRYMNALAQFAGSEDHS